jgi:hypothetical protein
MNKRLKIKLEGKEEDNKPKISNKGNYRKNSRNSHKEQDYNQRNY